MIKLDKDRITVYFNKPKILYVSYLFILVFIIQSIKFYKILTCKVIPKPYLAVI